MIAARLAWRYLRGRGLRSALTSLAVAFGVMLIFGLNGVIPTMIEAFTRSLLSTAGKIDLTVTSSFNQPFGRDILDRIARVDGVAVASPEVQRSAPLPVDADLPLADQVAALNVIGIDPATAGRVRDFPLVAGRALVLGDGDVVKVVAGG